MKEQDKKDRPNANLVFFKELIQLAKSEGLEELRYKVSELEVSFSFPRAGAPLGFSSYPPAHEVHARTQASSTPADSAQKADGLHEIRSPFVGTFYRRAAPNEPNYVKEGDKIHVGKVLCILEAMKIMNEIESDVSGEVVEICVENESLVEFGQLLFKVRKA